MIVDAAEYVGGQRRRSFSSIEAVELPDGTDEFVWLGLKTPSETELSAVADRFSIPEPAIEDARLVHDRPKVEQHGDVLLAVVRTARYIDSREVVEFGEIFVYLGQHFVVTVRYGQAAPLAGARNQLELEPEVLALGPGAVLAAALRQVVQSYEPVLAGLEHDVREVERDVFSSSRQRPTRRIYFLIREMLDFLVALEPLSAAVKELASPDCDRWVRHEVDPLLDDIDDGLSELAERARNLYALLNNALSANATQVSLKQNEDMRRISAWVAIGVIPTVVSGIFGMNFEHLPALHTWWGPIVVLTLTMLACAILYRRFKAAEWL